MTVLVFLYHRTPAGSAEEHFDVPLDVFREQINRLVDCGVSFIKFRDSLQEENLAHGLKVAITFDDGHISNLAAFEFLAAKKIIPAAFIVRDWARDRRDFLSSGALSDLVPICDFGAHGVTHAALTRMPERQLYDELASSRAFVEDATGSPVDTMALPGGHGDVRVVCAASKSGFRVIGNSVPATNRRRGPTVNRITITREDDVERLRDLSSTGNLVWYCREARIAASTWARGVLGSRNFRLLSRAIKRPATH